MSVSTDVNPAGGSFAPRGARPVVTWAKKVVGSTPWWARVLAIFVAARLVTTVMMLILAAQQTKNQWTVTGPSYADFASIWDGRWYNIIALAGYPSELPLTPDGYVQENAWAFMPVYPAIVRVLMMVTGLGWAPAAVTISVLAAAASTLVFYRLMCRVLDEKTALFAVVIFTVAPVSPMMQVAYAESLHILLLASALYLVLTRRYLTLIPVIVVMSFTRPSGLAFALFLGLHLIYRWVTRARDGTVLTDLWKPALAAVVSAVAGFGWLVIAGLVTGRPSAYIDTELAWRSSYVGRDHLVPFTPWIQGFDWWASEQLGLPEGVPWGLIGVVVMVALFAVWMFSRPVKRLGVDLRLWSVSYVVYLLAVFFPQSSTFRLLVPLFPLAGALAVPRSTVYRVTIVVVSLAAQWVWLLIAWRVHGIDWTPP